MTDTGFSLGSARSMPTLTCGDSGGAGHDPIPKLTVALPMMSYPGRSGPCHGPRYQSHLNDVLFVRHWYDAAKQELWGLDRSGKWTPIGSPRKVPFREE